MIKSKKQKLGIEIDLTGPDGNAFVLIGTAGNLAKQLGLDSKAIQAEMMKGDLLKAATWKAPAKHARGNIIDGTARYGVYGPEYL